MSENQQQPSIISNGQIIKGLSFIREDIKLDSNPNNMQPKIDITINLIYKLINSLNPDVYEVTLEMIAKAKQNDHEIFSIELDYAGIFTIKNFSAEQLDLILNIHCPALIFPFARRVIADTTREAGFMPLMIDPVDFVGLYEQKKAQLKNQQNELQGGMLN